MGQINDAIKLARFAPTRNLAWPYMVAALKISGLQAACYVYLMPFGILGAACEWISLMMSDAIDWLMPERLMQLLRRLKSEYFAIADQARDEYLKAKEEWRASKEK